MYILNGCTCFDARLLVKAKSVRGCLASNNVRGGLLGGSVDFALTTATLMSY